MPRFDGLRALGMARELAPGVPFLFVSGTIGEELAIEALHRGAADYVLKDNLIVVAGLLFLLAIVGLAISSVWLRIAGPCDWMSWMPASSSTALQNLRSMITCPTSTLMLISTKKLRSSHSTAISTRKA